MQSNEAQLGIPDRLWAWFETRKKEVLWGLAAIVAAGLGIGFFFWRQDERQASANEALARVANPGAAEQGPTPESLLAVTADYRNTDAGARALLLAGGTLFNQGKYAEAKTQFERFLREYRVSPLARQALLGLAVCLDAQGKTSEAITAYNDLVQHYSTETGVPENFVPQAKLGLASLYDQQGKWPQARDLYMDLIRNRYGSVSSEAEIHLESLFSKHPELIPGRPVSTNVPALRISH